MAVGVYRPGRSEDGVTPIAECGPDGGPSVQEIVAAYLADLRSRCSPEHVAKVEQQLQTMLIACPRQTPFEVAQWRSCRLQGGTAPRTVSMYVGAVRAFWRWAVAMGLRIVDPLGGLPAIRGRQADIRRHRRAMTEAEVRAFLAAADRIDRHYLYPQLPLWLTLIEGGLRIGEATRLVRDDLVGDMLIVRAASAKARRERRVPIRPDLANWLRQMAPFGVLFRTPRGKPFTATGRRNALRLFGKTCAEAGIERMDASGASLDIHALRVTAGTRMARHGVSLAVAAKVLGHSDPRLTSRIYQVLDDADLRHGLAGTLAKPPA